MMQMYFKNVMELNNLLEEKESSISIITDFFLANEVDVVYILRGDNLLAVVSIGDLYRYYKGTEEDFIVNTNFSYVSEIDYYEASRIFERIQTIYEVPVLQSGKFIGVIKRESIRSKSEWNNRRDELRQLLDKKNRTNFFLEELKRWKKNYANIDLYIYKNVGDIYSFLSEEWKLIYNKKVCENQAAEFDRLEWEMQHGYNVECRNLTVVQKNGFIILMIITKMK